MSEISLQYKPFSRNSSTICRIAFLARSTAEVRNAGLRSRSGGGPLGGVILCTPVLWNVFNANPNHPQQNAVPEKQEPECWPPRYEIKSAEPEAQQNENADNGGNQV
jgi:hypothetical protein